MNEFRLKEILRNIPLIAGRVYESTPISEFWDAGAIAREYQRRFVTKQATSAINGILNTLIDHGLVYEPLPGKYMRVAVKKKKPQLEMQDKAIMNTTVQPGKSGANPMDILMPFAERALDIAKRQSQLTSDVAQFKADFENAVIDIATMFQAHEKAAEKFNQLQSLFKD
jgi:hypothetical protein